MGIYKTLECARTSIFWPNITNDIKKLLSQCRACAQHQDKQPNESIISEPELKPWTSLSIDNFEYKGRHYLIILDRCTKFVVVKHVHSYDAGITVETMCEVFSEFGLPEIIHSDRGKNFYPINSHNSLTLWVLILHFAVPIIIQVTQLNVLSEM